MPIRYRRNDLYQQRLQEEKIFVMDENRAIEQDIRPLIF